jgi:hypothetical protein
MPMTTLSVVVGIPILLLLARQTAQPNIKVPMNENQSSSNTNQRGTFLFMAGTLGEMPCSK